MTAHEDEPSGWQPGSHEHVVIRHCIDQTESVGLKFEPDNKLTLSLYVTLELSYFTRNTDLTDMQLVDRVLDCTREEREAFAAEAKIALVKLLSGEGCEED
jgi:hypothetical protein